MTSPLGGPKDTTTTGPRADSGDQPYTTRVPRGVHGASTSLLPSGSAADLRGEDARTLAERHAWLVDRFIADYAHDTGKKATDASVRKVANATVSLFESEPEAKKLFNPRDNRGWLKLFTSAPQTSPDKLAARQHKGVDTVRDFTTALGDGVEERLEHFHQAIQTNPNLLKTKVGLFSRSTREQRQQMRAIAAGLLLCGFDADSVAYAMKAMRAAINQDAKSDAGLALAYQDMQTFIRSGDADDDPAEMVGHRYRLDLVLGFLRGAAKKAGKAHVSEAVPSLLQQPAAPPRTPTPPKPPKTGRRVSRNEPSKTDSRSAWTVPSKTDSRSARNQPARTTGRAPQSQHPSANRHVPRNDAPSFMLKDQFLKTDIGELEKAAADVATKEVGANPNYIERQSNALCGQHAANAYLHGRVISEASLSAFLRLNAFWQTPDLDVIGNHENFDPTRGNESDNLSNYLNWLNGKGLLGPDQRPLRVVQYNRSTAHELSWDPPRDSHMMYYMEDGLIAHFVALHPREEGQFAVYDSRMSGHPQEPVDPVGFANARIFGEDGDGRQGKALNLLGTMFGVRPNPQMANTVVVLRPARDGFATRRALADPMTIDKVRDLDSARMTLLREFLRAATDLDRNGTGGEPAAQALADEKDAVADGAVPAQHVQDEAADSELVRALSADFPELAHLARRVGAMNIEARAMPEERAAMRAVVDEAFQQIAPMQRVEQLRLFVGLGIYKEAQARQNYAEHVLKQHWPNLAQEKRQRVSDAVRNEPRAPRGRVLDAEYCTAIEQLTIRKAHELLKLELPAQALAAGSDLQAGGPAQQQTVPERDAKDDESGP